MTKSIKSIIDYSGVGAVLVDVECHITNGLPAIVIIGHASKAVDEAKIDCGPASLNPKFRCQKNGLLLICRLPTYRRMLPV